jgi:hypothetical protein
MNKKEFLIVIIITFVVFMVWIIADIVYVKPDSKINPKALTLLSDGEKVVPVFNEHIIKEIKKISSPGYQATSSAQEIDTADNVDPENND